MAETQMASTQRSVDVEPIATDPLVQRDPRGPHDVAVHHDPRVQNPVHHDPRAAHHDHVVHHEPQHAEDRKPSGMFKPLLKPFFALLQLALAVTLFGLLAYQAYHVNANAAQGGNSTQNGNQTRSGNQTLLPTQQRGTDYPGETFSNAHLAAAGFNAAGAGMLFFGLIFAVLQAVVAVAMWLQLAFWMPHVKHSSIVNPLKVTLAIGFIALGFACRHINLGALGDDQHTRITHAIEAFIIINWFYVLLMVILSATNVNWTCENHLDHRLTRQHVVSYTQFFLSLILIGLLAGWFQLWTEGWAVHVTSLIDLMTGFAILFAVLQCVTGLTMMQQSGFGAPGQIGETVLGLLKITNAFGLLAFGFACHSIYVTSRNDDYYNNNNNNNGNNNGNDYYNHTPAHLIAIEAFVIINFAYSLFCQYVTVTGVFLWETPNVVQGHGIRPLLFGIVHLVFSVILFGLIAAVLQDVTGNGGNTRAAGLNAAGSWMTLFGLLFAVLEFFTALTLLELSFHKAVPLLNCSVVSVLSKVTLAFGALAMGFACRHINLGMKYGAPGVTDDDRIPLIHAVEAFIIINFFLTWLIDVANNKGKIEY